jgi:hypothetical protein
MNSAYNHVKFLGEWQRAIIEAVSCANSENSNRFFQIQNHPDCFEIEGKTIYIGVRLTTIIKGESVVFWIGIDVTHVDTDKGDVMLYFDADTNSETAIKAIKDATLKNSTLDSSVKNGARLVLKEELLNSADNNADKKKEAIKAFFTEAVDVIRSSL